MMDDEDSALECRWCKLRLPAALLLDHALTAHPDEAGAALARPEVERERQRGGR